MSVRSGPIHHGGFNIGLLLWVKVAQIELPAHLDPQVVPPSCGWSSAQVERRIGRNLADGNRRIDQRLDSASGEGNAEHLDMKNFIEARFTVNQCLKIAGAPFLDQVRFAGGSPKFRGNVEALSAAPWGPINPFRLCLDQAGMGSRADGARRSSVRAESGGNQLKRLGRADPFFRHAVRLSPRTPAHTSGPSLLPVMPALARGR